MNIVEVVKFLKEWGSHFGFIQDDILKNLEFSTFKFIEVVKSELENSIKKKYGTHRPEIPNISSNVDVFLGSLTLEACRRKFEQCARDLQEKLTLTLIRQEKKLKSPALKNLISKSSHTFLQSCILDDCASSAPEGLFTPLDSKLYNLPENLLEKWNTSLLIVGAPGFGKTSFCRWNVLNDAERFNSGKSEVLPLYLPLYRLARKEIDKFENVFLRGFNHSALLPDLSKKKGNKIDKPLRIYLDGLDEVPSDEQKKKIIDLAKKGAGENPNIQIIVTAREHVHGSWLLWLPRISLSGFNNRAIKTLVSSWIENKSEVNRLLNQLDITPPLRVLMNTPLLATLITLLFKKTGKLPENKTKLYEDFVHLFSGDWDSIKKVNRESKFGQEVKLGVIASLASLCHGKELREFDDYIFQSAIKSYNRPLGIKWASFKQELIEDGLIIKNADLMCFSHLSFQEFLCAKDYITDQQPKRIRSVLQNYLKGNDWWREVIGFYIGLSKKPEQLTRWLLGELNNDSDTYDLERVKSLFAFVEESNPFFETKSYLPERYW